jgi:hypothetical protein
MFIIACARFWKYIYVLYILGVSHSHKNAVYLQHVRLDACISAAPAGRISVRLDIGDFYEYLLRNSRFPDLVNIILCRKAEVLFFIFLLAILNRHKRAYFE